MSHEFHSNYPLGIKDSVTQVFAIDFLVHKQPDPPTRWTEQSEIEDDWMRLMILSQSIATPYKEQARSGMRRDPGGYSYWLKNRSSVFLHRRLEEMKAFNLTVSKTNLPSITDFPQGSWTLNVPFTLRKPYISRDDTDFYIIDNPVKKEWVFKVPYVAPSQWKGALRSAMVRELVNEAPLPEEFAQRRFRMAVLFGDEKGENPGNLSGLAEYLDNRGGLQAGKIYRQLVQEHFSWESSALLSHHKGILHFYPTYFDRIGLEVINPHDREMGSGKQPIHFECVPSGIDSKGNFTLLCVPLSGLDMSIDQAKRQAEDDFKAVSKGVKAMMTRYGFGAKTSSGFGVADVSWEDAIITPEAEFQQHWKDAWREEAA